MPNQVPTTGYSTIDVKHTHDTCLYLFSNIHDDTKIQKASFYLGLEGAQVKVLPLFFLIICGVLNFLNSYKA